MKLSSSSSSSSLSSSSPPLSVLLVVILVALTLCCSTATSSNTLTTSTTSTSASASATSNTPLRQLSEFSEIIPYPDGTRVYHFSENNWHPGTIIKYFDGVYTVTWDETGSHEYFDDLPQVDAMVRNAEAHANVDLYDMGTHVKDNEDRGIIVDFLDGKYRVEWNDGSVEHYLPGMVLDGLVGEAMLDVVQTTAAPQEQQQPQAETSTTTTTTQDLYSIGTKVVSGNNQGTIVDFVDGMYRVQWSDGATRSHSPGPSLDRMVSAAASEDPEQQDSEESQQSQEQQEQPQPQQQQEPQYEMGTHAKHENLRCTIVDFVDNTYELKCSDGSTQMYPPGAEFDAMVEEAVLDELEMNEATEEPTFQDTMEGTDANDDDDFDPYDIGTRVSKASPEKGNVFGTISWYRDGVYEIMWEDGTTEQYDDEDAIEDMVQRAERTNQGDPFEMDPWDNGIAVFKNFQGEGPLFGKITNYHNGKYNIRWSNGREEEYTIDETDAMVKAAYEEVRASQSAAIEEDSSLGAGSKFMLVVVVMAGIISAGFIVKRRRTGIEKNYEPDRNQNIAPVYTDDPIKDDVTASDAEPPMDVPDII